MKNIGKILSVWGLTMIPFIILFGIDGWPEELKYILLFLMLIEMLTVYFFTYMNDEPKSK